MGNRDLAQNARELVRQQDRHRDYVSGRPECRQGDSRLATCQYNFRSRANTMPVHPDVFAQKWNLQFAVTPVIPKPVKGNLFSD